MARGTTARPRLRQALVWPPRAEGGCRAPPWCARQPSRPSQDGRVCHYVPTTIYRHDRAQRYTYTVIWVIAVIENVPMEVGTNLVIDSPVAIQAPPSTPAKGPGSSAPCSSRLYASE
jgi:hypothetical protein